MLVSEDDDCKTLLALTKDIFEDIVLYNKVYLLLSRLTLLLKRRFLKCIFFGQLGFVFSLRINKCLICNFGKMYSASKPPPFSDKATPLPSSDRATPSPICRVVNQVSQ